MPLRVDGGFVVNGAKTFITNGIHADIIIVVARTGEHSRKGLSLIVIERGMTGFDRGRQLDKLGMHAQDTAELFFTDVLVPESHLLDNEGEACHNLTKNLAQERLAIAVASIAQAVVAFALTVAYVRDRHVFGKPLGMQQNTRFRLAEVATEIEIAQRPRTQRRGVECRRCGQGQVVDH